jgi:hypothetical protein
MAFSSNSPAIIYLYNNYIFFTWSYRTSIRPSRSRPSARAIDPISASEVPSYSTPCRVCAPAPRRVESIAFLTPRNRGGGGVLRGGSIGTEDASLINAFALLPMDERPSYNKYAYSPPSSFALAGGSGGIFVPCERGYCCEFCCPEDVVMMLTKKNRVGEKPSAFFSSSRRFVFCV